MPLGMEVGLGPGDIMLDGDPAPPSQRGTAPQCLARIYCGQTVAHLSCCSALDELLLYTRFLFIIMNLGVFVV